LDHPTRNLHFRPIANSILVKVNQLGTLTETLDAIEVARKAAYGAVMQARFDAGSELVGAIDHSGPPVGRLRSAPANGASSAE